MHVRAIALSAAALAVAASTLGLAGAHTKETGCTGNITKYETPAGTIYTDDHGPSDFPVSVPGVADEFWIYMESNGHEGLQKGGWYAQEVLNQEDGELVGGYDACDTSHQDSGHDTPLF